MVLHDSCCPYLSLFWRSPCIYDTCRGFRALGVAMSCKLWYVVDSRKKAVGFCAIFRSTSLWALQWSRNGSTSFHTSASYHPMVCIHCDTDSLSFLFCITRYHYSNIVASAVKRQQIHDRRSLFRWEANACISRAWSSFGDSIPRKECVGAICCILVWLGEIWCLLQRSTSYASNSCRHFAFNTS